MQAANNGAEELEYTALAWYELNHFEFDVRQAWAYIKTVKTVLVLNARDLYDAVAKNESAACGMTDRCSAIEALALKQALRWGDAQLRWVHSQAQLADVLTKSSAGFIGRMMRFFPRDSGGLWTT